MNKQALALRPIFRSFNVLRLIFNNKSLNGEDKVTILDQFAEEVRRVSGIQPQKYKERRLEDVLSAIEKIKNDPFKIRRISERIKNFITSIEEVNSSEFTTN